MPVRSFNETDSIHQCLFPLTLKNSTWSYYYYTQQLLITAIFIISTNGEQFNNLWFQFNNTIWKTSSSELVRVKFWKNYCFRPTEENNELRIELCWTRSSLGEAVSRTWGYGTLRVPNNDTGENVNHQQILNNPSVLWWIKAAQIESVHAQGSESQRELQQRNCNWQDRCSFLEKRVRREKGWGRDGTCHVLLLSWSWSIER